MWGHVNYEFILAIGKSRGLLIMWNPTKVEAIRIPCPSNRCLSMEVKCKVTNFNFGISNICASNIIARIKIIWNMFSNHQTLFQNLL